MPIRTWVRGTVVLPAGTGRDVRVLVIARGPKEQEAKDAGADMVGADEYLPKIKDGWTDVGRHHRHSRHDG